MRNENFENYIQDVFENREQKQVITMGVLEREKYFVTVVKEGGLLLYDMNENKFQKELNDVKGAKIIAAFFAKVKNDNIVLALGLDNNTAILLDEELIVKFISEPEKFDSELIL